MINKISIATSPMFCEACCEQSEHVPCKRCGYDGPLSDLEGVEDDVCEVCLGTGTVENMVETDDDSIVTLETCPECGI